jgi:ribonuclease HII
MSHAVTSHDIDQISYDQIGYDQTGYDQISYEALCAELNDSKMLTESTRERLAVSIKQHALAWVTAQASAAEVDSHNVLAATHLAAKRSLAALPISLDGLVTDYLKLDTLLALLAPAKADSLSLQVAAASILAKTTRDALMRAAHKSYPHYGFVTNKGYGAKKHLQAINEHGICPLHRRTFKPVAERLVAAEPLRHFQMDASETS